MSLAPSALADASIADVKKESGKKLQPKRTYTAVADSNVVPEPR